MDTATLIRAAQLDLLNEIHRVCQKHGISYFLAEGTLIGAIRHKGFIPWDDDLDIAMLREDYDRFRQVYAQEADPEYELVDWHNDPHSPLPFMKLKIRGTHYREAIMADSQANDAIFVDIFPMDNVPDTQKKRNSQRRQANIILKLLFARCHYRLELNSSLKKLIFRVLGAVSHLRSAQGWKRSYEKILLRYNQTPAEFVDMVYFRNPNRFMRREDLEETVLHPFETGMYPVPREYDTYLRRVYGDYMVLPPEDQRVGIHRVYDIDLGNYQLRTKL